MNRFHVHLNVADLGSSIRFYTQLFAAPPAVVKDDYAKWMLDDPRINFAISNTGRAPGVDHLGLQVDSGEELAALGRRLDAAGGKIVPQLWHQGVCREAGTGPFPDAPRVSPSGIWGEPVKHRSSRPTRSSTSPAEAPDWGVQRRCSRWGTVLSAAGRRHAPGWMRRVTTRRLPMSVRWRSECWRRLGCCLTSTPG